MQKELKNFSIEMDKKSIVDLVNDFEAEFKKTRGYYYKFLTEQLLSLLDKSFADISDPALIPNDYVKIINQNNLNQIFKTNKTYRYDILKCFLDVIKNRDKIDLYPHFLNFMLTDDKVDDCIYYLDKFKDKFKNELFSDESISLYFLNHAGKNNDKKTFYSSNCTFILKIILHKKFDINKILTPEKSDIVINYLESYFKYNRSFAKSFLKLLEDNEEKVSLIYGSQPMPKRLSDLYNKESTLQIETKDESFANIVGLSKGFTHKIQSPSHTSTELSKSDIKNMVQEGKEVYYACQLFDVSRYCAKNNEDINNVKYILRNVYLKMEDDKRFPAPITVFEDKQSLQRFHFVFFNKSDRDEFIQVFEELTNYCLAGVNKKQIYGEILKQTKLHVDKFYQILALESQLNDKDNENQKKKTKKI